MGQMLLSSLPLKYNWLLHFHLKIVSGPQRISYFFLIMITVDTHWLNKISNFVSWTPVVLESGTHSRKKMLWIIRYLKTFCVWANYIRWFRLFLQQWQFIHYLQSFLFCIFIFFNFAYLLKLLNWNWTWILFV